MIFATESAIQAPETDLADDTGEDHEWAEVSDDDAPELLSESESESDTDADSDDETAPAEARRTGRK